MTIEEFLSSWMGSQRWYTGAAARPDVEVLSTAPLSDSTAFYLVKADGLTFSVPLTRDADGVYLDATDCREGQEAILAAALGAPIPDSSLGLKARVLHGADLGQLASAKKLASEQSNTSIIYRFADGSGIILKVFRVVNEGRNPEVELMTALDAAGATAVPHQFGSLSAAVPDADMAVAQEFLDGAKDAWQVLTDGLENTDGTLADTESLVDLGRMTREIHDLLASSFPTVEASPELKAHIRATWKARAERAIADASSLASDVERINEILDATESIEWPRLQRIHGDYHLGQVLSAPGRGWFALDFEGEPLRPLAERSEPDLAARDVAGMLRSFDYAAGSAMLKGGNPEACTAWSDAASAAFMKGYEQGDNDVLLEALILDKALYEVSYEAASRPTWISIPLAGVQRILSRDSPKLNPQ